MPLQSFYCLLLLIMCCFASGCGSDYPSEGHSQTGAPELPLSEGIYYANTSEPGSYYKELVKLPSGKIESTKQVFHEESASYTPIDNSEITGGRLYIELVEGGWKYGTTVSRDRYIENGYLVRQFEAFGSEELRFSSSRSLSGMEISEALGEKFAWASGFFFSSDAEQFFFRPVLNKELYIITASTRCGEDCYGIRSLGGGTYVEKMAEHSIDLTEEVTSGYYWLGLSLFFDPDGSVHIYSYFDASAGLLSSEGSWDLLEINEEEILVMTIPHSVKKDFGIRYETNPIIAEVGNTLHPGSWVSLTLDIVSDDRELDYFLNESAMSDLKGAYLLAR